MVGPIAIIFNLPVQELSIARLHLSRQVIVEIFSGQIRYWNDPKIQRLNPDISLPSQEIVRVVRSDGSGTTEIFTDALSNFDPTGFGRTIGKTSTVINWGNETSTNIIRVAGATRISSTVFSKPYSISYNVFSTAVRTNQIAAVQNRAGAFIVPSLETVQVL